MTAYGAALFAEFSGYDNWKLASPDDGYSYAGEPEQDERPEPTCAEEATRAADNAYALALKDCPRGCTCPDHRDVEF